MPVKRLSQKGMSLVQAMVSFAIVGGIAMSLMKFNSIKFKSHKTTVLSRKNNMARNLLEEFLSVPSFCGDFFQGKLSNNVIRTGSDLSIRNDSIIRNMGFNKQGSPIKFEVINIQPVSGLSTISRNSTRTVRGFINFQIQNDQANQRNKKLYGEDLSVLFQLRKNEFDQLSFAGKCHLEKSIVVAQQKMLCDESGGVYDNNNYQCLFDDKSIQEYLCEIEKTVLLVEKAGRPTICTTSAVAQRDRRGRVTGWTCSGGGRVLMRGIPPAPDKKTSFCERFQ